MLVVSFIFQCFVKSFFFFSILNLNSLLAVKNKYDFFQDVFCHHQAVPDRTRASSEIYPRRDSDLRSRENAYPEQVKKTTDVEVGILGLAVSVSCSNSS